MQLLLKWLQGTCTKFCTYNIYPPDAFHLGAVISYTPSKYTATVRDQTREIPTIAMDLM